MSRVGIDEDIRISNIERMWTKLMNALTEREKWLQDEVGQSDKLHRLAEKILRECRQTESKLDEIEQRVEEEIRRADRLHPDDLKANCRQIELELDHCHETIESMLRDCQKLRDGRYPQAGDVQRR
jgi:septation ring formation regulator EzrA